MNTVNFVNGKLEIQDAEGIIWFCQPTWPDGTEWANESEAQAWGEALLAHLENPKTEQNPDGLLPPTDGPA